MCAGGEREKKERVGESESGAIQQACGTGGGSVRSREGFEHGDAQLALVSFTASPVTVATVAEAIRRRSILR